MIETTSSYPYGGGYGFNNNGIFALIIWILFIWILLIVLGRFFFRPIVY